MNGVSAWLPKKKSLLALFGLVLLISLAVNLATIITFPSWDDEAYLANISFNLAHGQGRVLDLIPGGESGEINRYGPVFFLFQSAFIRLFGLHAWLFRLPNLAFSYLSILLIALTLKNSNISRAWILIYGFFAVLDISVNRNMVGGRMDMMATFFVCLTLYLASLSRVSQRVDWLRWLVAGGSAALAFLTTPRALFLLPVVVPVALSHRFSSQAKRDRRRALWQPLLAFVCFALPVAAWIGSLGGVGAYLAIQNSGVVRDHIAPSFLRAPYDNIAISILLLLACLGYKRLLRSPIILGLFLNYLSFGLFVREVGPYAGMIMPFVLAAVAALLSESRMKRALKLGLALLILVPSATVLAARAADLPLNANCRRSDFLQTLTSRITSENRRSLQIVVDYKYYFYLENPRHRLFALEGSPTQREASIRNADILLDTSPAAAAAAGLSAAGKLACTPRKLPLLPQSFYDRSIFNETIYIRPKSI